MTMTRILLNSVCKPTIRNEPYFTYRKESYKILLRKWGDPVMPVTQGMASGIPDLQIPKDVPSDRPATWTHREKRTRMVSEAAGKSQ